MFAWIHQAIPTEKENLLLLLKQCDKHGKIFEKIGARIVSLMKSIFVDLTDQIQTALSHISDGICHPLKVRVETIFNSEKDLIVLYAVANLMRFYQNIINNVI
jgi:conserved oligomeric Golgi complex subunit 6